MAKVSDHVQRLRDEVADGLAPLVAVASQAGSAAGEESRQRAVEALHALRGDRPRQWRWLLIGAALGFAAGFVSAGVARRQLLSDDDAAGGITEKVRDTAAPVRDAATKVRDKFSNTDTDEHSPAQS